ncbi:uncharacterized protein LOC133174021 [Saccostrea echinata]|uniref:uncharacterized protein LOC133174021 n=1 Tax=Saccostrea echinata TaxID=191078 RepID=UPI002A8082D6|nr:uncharacterized protein LOC133174021 [Saccostrea echinata]
MVDRDCKPADRLTKSYFHGACGVPLSGETIGEVLLHEEIDPDKVIFAAPELNQKMTVKELRKESLLFSKWLIKNGIQKGSIVLVNGVADLKYFPLLLGTVSIGCICQSAFDSHFKSQLQVCYGASECLVGTCTSPVLSTPDQRLDTVGYPFPHTEVKVIGDKDEILPINVQGEICIKGFGVFYGYLNNNEPGTGPLDNQGWLHTGDIGKMDETSHVTYIGRKTDCLFFKHNGEKIYPKQLTEIISSHADVLGSAVVGIQSDEQGDNFFIFYV